MLGVAPMLMGGGAGGTLLPQAVFATSLYTGTGAAQTIANGLDLAGQGGLVWSKDRSAAQSSSLADTARGRALYLKTDTSGGESGPAGATNDLTSFNANGFSLGVPSGFTVNNNSGDTFVAWSFRQAPKFFQIVTYTGNGVAGRQIPHTLGIAPGMIVVKRRDASSTSGWPVWHRARTGTQTLLLNTTGAWLNSPTMFADGTSGVDPTALVFTVGNFADVNATGATYVAYLWAHDPDTVNGIVQCGSYTGNGSASGPSINLGWKPQFLVIKAASATFGWFMLDTSRGLGPGNDPYLFANTSGAEVSGTDIANTSSAGFSLAQTGSGVNGSGDSYVYLAIREPIL